MRRLLLQLLLRMPMKIALLPFASCLAEMCSCHCEQCTNSTNVAVMTVLRTRALMQYGKMRRQRQRQRMGTEVEAHS